ncbi:hypothetical protein FD755_015460, partial [Muntiacus reevesi]
TKYSKHQPPKVTQNKISKDSLHPQGNQRHDRKQRGHGGQTTPIFQKKAKTTKIILRLECIEALSSTAYLRECSLLRDNFTICMEIQKTSNSQSNLKKEEWNWRNQPA